MKKAGIAALVLAVVAMAAFLLGFYTGRNSASSQITLATIPATAAQAPTTASTASPTFPETAPAETITGGLININTASAAELTLLPGIGDVIAQRIVDYREANGPFTSLSQLTDVEGIGEKRLEGILTLATIGG